MKAALVLAALALVAVAGAKAEDPVVRALRELQATSVNQNPSADNQLGAVLTKISSALQGLSKAGVPSGEVQALEAQKLEKKGKNINQADTLGLDNFNRQ